MQCPFCNSANVATSRACRVCGGPLRAAKPKIAPVSIAPIPIELVRQGFEESAEKLVSADFLPDENSTICLVRESGVVQLWNARNNELSSFSLTRLFRKPSRICCALSARDFIATGYENGEVRWHELNGHERKRPAAHIGRVLALAANATHFYSGGNDGVVWSTEIGDKQAKSCALLEGLSALTTFAASSDATLIAVGCDDGAVQLWRANDESTSAKLDWTRRGHNAPIGSVLFSPNDQMIISRDKAGAVCLWATQTSYQLPLAPGAQYSSVAPLFSSDNRLLVLGNSKNGVSIFDVPLEILSDELPPFGEQITHLSFAPDAPWLLVAGARQIAVWNVD